MIIHKGDKAPNFCLYNTEKEQVTLEEYREKTVVLLFFPFAWSGQCTEELDNVRDQYDSFEDVGAEVLAISVDSPYTLKAFKEKRDYPFLLLSDFNKEVSRAYGTLYEDYAMDLRGVSKRSAYVIDPKGTVRYAEVLDNAERVPDFERIKDILKKIDS